jgi:hypothetical protein
MQALPDMSLRQRYQTLALQSRRMCEAARRNDWERLTRMSRTYVQTITAIEQLPGIDPLDEHDRIACQLELASIIALNEETDRLARAELGAIRSKLGSLRQSSRLVRSYGRIQASLPTRSK